MAITRLGPNNSTNISGINLTSQVTGTLPTGNGGTGATSFSPGKVLQVVTDEVSGQVSSTSTSYVDITGLSVTITPSSTSSKIYVIANLCSCRTQQSSSTSNNAFYNLVRGSTELTSSRLNYYDAEDNTNRETDGTITLTNLDEPNTTSATTYKCQFKKFSSGTVYINESSDNSPVSSITVMEIAG
jgi:hypothetical protein